MIITITRFYALVKDKIESSVPNKGIILSTHVLVFIEKDMKERPSPESVEAFLTASQETQ